MKRWYFNIECHLIHSVEKANCFDLRDQSLIKIKTLVQAGTDDSIHWDGCPAPTFSASVASSVSLCSEVKAEGLEARMAECASGSFNFPAGDQRLLPFTALQIMFTFLLTVTITFPQPLPYI